MTFELSGKNAHVYASPEPGRCEVVVLYRDLSLFLDPDEAEMLKLALTRAIEKARQKPTMLYQGSP